MDPELKAHLEAMESRLTAKIDEQGRELTARIDEQGARIDGQGRDLRGLIAELKQRVDEGFAARKQDEDLALSEIDALRKRFGRLEQRVTALEQANA